MMKRRKLSNIHLRSKQVNILISELELYNLQEKCAKSDTKISTYVRKLVIEDLKK